MFLVTSVIITETTNVLPFPEINIMQTHHILNLRHHILSLRCHILNIQCDILWQFLPQKNILHSISYFPVSFQAYILFSLVFQIKKIFLQINKQHYYKYANNFSNRKKNNKKYVVKTVQKCS